VRSFWAGENDESRSAELIRRSSIRDSSVDDAVLLWRLAHNVYLKRDVRLALLIMFLEQAEV
jgi:hypothetical protein